MSVNKIDIVRLHASYIASGAHPNTPMPPLAGAILTELADGTEIPRNILLLDINLSNRFNLTNPQAPWGYVLPRWTTIQCAVVPEHPSGQNPIRLSGPWLRKMLFTATVPDRSNGLLVFDEQPGIGLLHHHCNNVPKDPNLRVPPAFLPLKPVNNPWNY